MKGKCSKGKERSLRGLSRRTDSGRIFRFQGKNLFTQKNAPKNGIFSPKFCTEVFPKFLVCVFCICSKKLKCHRKTASKKFSQKIHHSTEQNPECRCGRAGSLSICPFEKQKLSRKTKISSARSSAPLCLPRKKQGDPGQKGENQRAPNPPEFAQPGLSRSKRRLSPARSGISTPMVWGTRGLHPGFPWFSSFPRFP